jgi:hypothetical protein
VSAEPHTFTLKQQKKVDAENALAGIPVLLSIMGVVWL